MRATLHRARPDILIILLLLAVPLLFFLPQTLGGRTLLPADNLYQWEPYNDLAGELGVGRPHNPLLSDLILQNAPWKLFARAEIAAGEIPLWQPNILAGSPFLAAGQSSMLYPFSLLTLILPLWAAYGWFTVLQLWIAGLNTYLLLRVLGVRRPGALIAALTYQMAGFMLASAVFPMIIATAAWLPLILAMLELVLRQARALNGLPASLPWAVIGAGALGMAVLAGHVEALYFTLLVAAFYAAWRLGAMLLVHRREPGIWGCVLRRGLWAALMVAGGLALGAVQLIPAYELASRSFRAGEAGLAEVLGWAYPARRAIAFLMPNFFGSPAHQHIFDVFMWQRIPLTANAAGEPITSTAWGIKNYVEGAAYTGILPLLLAAAALVHWLLGRTRRGDSAPARHLARETADRPYRALFAVLGALSLSFAFGAPTYALLYYGLPFIDQSHAPFRWVWPLTLCVAVLAGFGVEALNPLSRKVARSATRSEGSGGEGRLATIFGWVGVAGGALVLIGVIVTRVFYGAFAGLVERVFFGLAGASNAFPDARAFYSHQAAGALLLGAALLLGGVIIHLMRRGSRAWLPLGVLVVALDLGAASWGFNPAADPALLDVTPPSIAWLAGQHDPLDPWRFGVYEEPGRDTLNANMGWLHGLEDISGYDSLIPAQYVEYMQALTPQGDLPYNRIAPLYSTDPAALDSPLLDQLGVRYVVTELEIDSPRYELAYEDEAVRIYENTEAMSRAFTLPLSSTMVYAAGEGGFAEAALSADVRRNVLLPFEPDLPAYPGTPAEPGPATITTNTAQQQTLDVTVEEESWLVVAGSYFPGWRAWLRPFGTEDDAEQEVPVELVSGNFRGVRLPPGEWTVRMKYSPDSFRFGAFASFLTGMGLLFALGVWAWRGLYRESPEVGGIQRIAKNTVTPIVLNIFNKGISFVLTFAMLRILGPADAGRYTYAMIVYGWFEILANFGLNTFLIREVSRHREDANHSFVNTTILRLMLVAVGVPLLAGFVLIRQAAVSPPLEPRTLWALGLLYGGLLFSTISTGLTALFYGYEKAEVPAAVQTVSAFLTTTLGITALLLGGGIVGLAAVSVAVNAVTLAVLGTLAVRHFFTPRPTFSWPFQRAALRESFPLMLNHLFATLFFRVDVILLEALQGPRVVGWYRVVYTWVDAIMVIPSYFTLSLFPVMSRMGASDRPALKRTYLLAVKLMSLISVPTAIMTTVLAPFLVNVLGGAEYLPHGAIALQVFIWSVVIGWINSVTQYVIIALDRQRTLTIAFVVVLAFNAGANLYYIPRYSYVAAAFITILSEFVLWGLFYVVVLSELGRINWARTLWRIAAAGVLTGAVTFYLAGISPWLGFAAGTLVYLLAILALRPLNRDERQRLAGILPERLRKRMVG